MDDHDQEPRRTAGAVDLGARLREERELAGVSVRGLARRLGVSASLLSQIERGLAQPSVGTLWAVVSELGLSLDSLFPAEPERPPGEPRVQRAEGRRAIELDRGVRWERLTPGPDAEVDFAFVTYEPGADAAPEGPRAAHRGREYGYVVSGRLAIDVGDDSLELGPGDAVVFGSRTPHRLRALGDEAVTAVWFNLARGG